MTSAKEEEELVKKDDILLENNGEKEEGMFDQDVQGGGGEDLHEDGVNQVAEEHNEEGGEDVEEEEQEANKKGEQRMPEEKAGDPKTVSGGNDNTETAKTAPAKKQKAKKGEAATNVNNEVVKMRTEVKRVRALLIRKLLRHLADLKKKKGNEADLERNKRRVERLVEEIRQMKRLKPDQVTKKALQTEFNFEEVCKDPKATMAKRALARIATHPQFTKKIDVIKAAVQAFDAERKKEKQKQKMTPFQEEEEQNALKEKEEETDDEEESDEQTEDEEADDGDEDETTGEFPEAGMETAAPVNATTETSKPKTVAFTKSVKTASTKNTEIKDALKEALQCKPAATKAPEKKQNVKPALKTQQSKKEDEEDGEEKQSNDDKEYDEEDNESDLESSDEGEKEYFDDSTEERFRKQSEGSESEDDFFVGKVSKFKKKKKKDHAAPNQKSQTSDDCQTEKPQSELNSKAPKLASVFCSLSGSKPGRGGLSRDRGRGRGGDRFRGRGRGGHRGGGPDRPPKGPSNFQKQDGGTRGKPEFKKNERGGSVAKQFQSEDRDRTFTGRGTGRGRGGVSRQQDSRLPGGSSHQAPQQALHPSWEASKKRKEQQGILAFQGKKIKFDDD